MLIDAVDACTPDVVYTLGLHADDSPDVDDSPDACTPTLCTPWGFRPDSEAEDQQVVDHYERERRSVIFTHYSESFAAAPTEADLEALGGQLKETIVKGHLDQHRVIELRVVYTDRLNVLRGFPADKDQLKASFDKFCGAVDSARSESSKLWHTTKKSTKASIKKFKKEVENQDFIYY